MPVANTPPPVPPRRRPSPNSSQQCPPPAGPVPNANAPAAGDQPNSRLQQKPNDIEQTPENPLSKAIRPVIEDRVVTLAVRELQGLEQTLNLIIEAKLKEVMPNKLAQLFGNNEIPPPPSCTCNSEDGPSDPNYPLVQPFMIPSDRPSTAPGGRNFASSPVSGNIQPLALRPLSALSGNDYDFSTGQPRPCLNLNIYLCDKDKEDSRAP